MHSKRLNNPIYRFYLRGFKNLNGKFGKVEKIQIFIKTWIKSIICQKLLILNLKNVLKQLKVY